MNQHHVKHGENAFYIEEGEHVKGLVDIRIIVDVAHFRKVNSKSVRQYVDKLARQNLLNSTYSVFTDIETKNIKSDGLATTAIKENTS